MAILVRSAQVLAADAALRHLPALRKRSSKAEQAHIDERELRLLQIVSGLPVELAERGVP
jgi:hypothetical protein